MAAVKAEFWQRGEALDYTNPTGVTIPAGTVVKIGTVLGVAGCDIEPHKVGSLHVGGVWEMPKEGSLEVAMGDELYLAEGAGNITKTSSGNVKCGYAAAPSATAETTVLVKLYG